MRLLLVAIVMTIAAGSPAERPQLYRALLERLETAQAFDCSKKTCKQITSCAEACYKLLQCGQTARDRDGDGIPCENVCSRPCR